MIQALAGGAVAVVVLGVVGLWTLEHRTEPGAAALLALLVVLGLLALVAVVGSSDRLAGETALSGAIALWLVAAVVWALFAFTYTGRGPTVTPRRGGGLFALAVVAAAAVFGAQITSVGGEVLALLVAPPLLGALSLAAFGCFLTARAGVDASDLPPGQSAALTVGGGVVTGLFLLVTADSLFGERATLAGVVLAVGASGGLFALAHRAGLFETGPGAGYLAREALLDRMGACVVLVDQSDSVLDCNRATERTFGVDVDEARGQQAASVLGSSPEPGLLTLETVEGRRKFDASRSQLRNRRGEAVGRVYVLRDVTRRRTHEQRLDVLDRVLRHNLRNELDAIRAFAETLPESDDPETLARRINETADGLAGTARKVGRAERLLAGDRPDTTEVDVAALAREVAAGFEMVETEAPDSLRVETDRRLLEAVLEELLDNAVTHTDHGATLAVSGGPSSVSLSVRDRGSGIPERERAVLLAGEETPLRHGSGLGLWFVYWAVVTLGGDLSFRENDPRGSVVGIELPRRRAEAPTTPEPDTVEAATEPAEP